MINISVMPKETLVELLLFLADNESFDSVKKNLREGMTVPEVRSALRELALQLAKEVPSACQSELDTLMKESGVSPKALKIISALSEREKKDFLSAFGFADN
jgi:hypothetical protein